jgi:thymidine kinase
MQNNSELTLPLRDSLHFTNQKMGQINLIIGCMFSGKTSLLINRYNRYTIGNKKCLMVKFQRDIRYDAYQVITHDGIAINAIKCEYLYELDDIVQNYDVICIDEIQFYKDAHIICDKWANQGLIINACGLSSDSNRKPFPIVSDLIALADDIIYTKAICRATGNDAVYSKLIKDESVTNTTLQERIGGADMYAAVDRVTFFDDLKTHRFELYKKFIDIYKNSINLDVDEIVTINKYDDNKNFKEMILIEKS